MSAPSGLRTVMTVPPPGYTPKGLTWEQTRDMAMIVAAACTEAGYPTETRPHTIQPSLLDDGATDWYFDPVPGHPRVPEDVLNRARALAFMRFGLTDLIEVSERDESLGTSWS